MLPGYSEFIRLRFVVCLRGRRYRPLTRPNLPNNVDRTNNSQSTSAVWNYDIAVAPATFLSHGSQAVSPAAVELPDFALGGYQIRRLDFARHHSANCDGRRV